MYEFIIIGGGITGVTLGRLLQMSGVNNFIILEAESEAGGLCRTKLIDGHYLDIGGGHFLCTKYPQVYDFIFSHIPKEEFNFSLDLFENPKPQEVKQPVNQLHPFLPLVRGTRYVHFPYRQNWLR